MLFKGQDLKNSTYLLTSLQKAALPSLSKTLWQRYFLIAEERAMASWMCSCWKGTAETFRNNSWKLILSRCTWLLSFYKSGTKLRCVPVLKHLLISKCKIVNIEQVKWICIQNALINKKMEAKLVANIR